MMGFKAFTSAAATLDGVEIVQMMRKHQGHFTFNLATTLKKQSEAIAAHAKPIFTLMKICNTTFQLGRCVSQTCDPPTLRSRTAPLVRKFPI